MITTSSKLMRANDKIAELELDINLLKTNIVELEEENEKLDIALDEVKNELEAYKAKYSLLEELFNAEDERPWWRFW